MNPHSPQNDRLADGFQNYGVDVIVVQTGRDDGHPPDQLRAAMDKYMTKARAA